MKTVSHLFARRLSLTLLAILTTTMLWASNTINTVTLGDHTFTVDEQGNYLIQTVEDWNGLADYVKAGNSCSEMIFKMTNDIDNITRSVGFQTTDNANSRQRFEGTFDGDGHILTINMSAENMGNNKNYCAPFAYVHNATFQNLTVLGTVNALNYKYASGLVGSMTGGGTIEDCHIGVTIQASLKGDGTHGSFVAIAESDITVDITNCWFDGQLLGEQTINCGGFVGYNKGTINFTNCLFNPELITFNASQSADLSSTFARKANNTRINNFTNCYYTKALGTEETDTKFVFALKDTNDNYSYGKVTAADKVDYYYIINSNIWCALQESLNKGGNVELTQDCFAGTNNDPLVVNAGVNVTLDLKGHTLDRNLFRETTAFDNGYVIKVCEGAELTINDTENGGIITGGKNTSNGGAIYSEGTLNINGGKITGNKANNGGGIYIAKNSVTFSGNVTITGNKNSKNNNDLYLCNKATATITNGCKLEANIISVQNGGSLILEDGGQLLTSSEVRITAQKTIKAYDIDAENTNGWYFIASPLKNDLQITNAITCNTYDLYRLNGTTWENYKKHDDFKSLNNGAAYLYANSENVTLQFTGTIQTFGKNKDIEIAKGWNLIGNPYTFDVYSDRPYYMIDENNSSTITLANETDAVKPCMGILVQCRDSEGGILSFSKEPKSWSQSSANGGNIQITVAQKVVTRSESSSKILDKAIVSFNEGEELGKFYFGQSNANISIPMNGEEFAIAHSEKHGELPMNFKAAVNGEYTLTVNPESAEMNYLHLIDNLTGAYIDLLIEPSYTFNAKSDDYASRFRLVFSTKDNSNEVSTNEDFAFISDGNIIVNGTGMLQVFDLTGRMIVSRRDVMHCISTAEITPGVYFLQLIDGNSVKNQKIMIK